MNGAFSGLCCFHTGKVTLALVLMTHRVRRGYLRALSLHASGSFLLKSVAFPILCLNNVLCFSVAMR